MSDCRYSGGREIMNDIELTTCASVGSSAVGCRKSNLTAQPKLTDERAIAIGLFENICCKYRNILNAI